MSIFYCHQCSASKGLIKALCSQTLDLTGNSYKLDKFMKHTAPHNMNGFVSVYDDPSYKSYKGYSINASLSGAVEIDDQNRKNVLYYADDNIGVTYCNSLPITIGDTVKLVLHENDNLVHSFPVASGSILKTEICAEYGCKVLI